MKPQGHSGTAGHPAARRRAPPVRQPGTTKEREIRFDKIRPQQAERALAILQGLEGLAATPGSLPHSIHVRYELTDYTMHGLENALAAQGFHLDSSLYMKILRAIVYFCEDTQLRNLRSPERLLKKSNEVYVKAWEHHPHGDHDDTPPELREYK